MEQFVAWDYPDDGEFSDYPRLSVAGRKKILGLNAARLYDIDVPAHLRAGEGEGTPASSDSTALAG